MSNETESHELEFQPFRKIPRLNRDVVVTEKIDGTNALVHIREADGFEVAPYNPEFDFVAVRDVPDPVYVRAGSRTRWISPGQDNFGFAAWVWAHAEELASLGPGAHYGEWWGRGIQRNYSQLGKHFSLFNVSQWTDSTARPACCDVVPTLYVGPFDLNRIRGLAKELEKGGSVAAPGFMNPEGLIVWHTAAQQFFKVTIDKDEEPKNVRTGR